MGGYILRVSDSSLTMKCGLNCKMTARELLKRFLHIVNHIRECDRPCKVHETTNCQHKSMRLTILLTGIPAQPPYNQNSVKASFIETSPNPEGVFCVSISTRIIVEYIASCICFVILSRKVRFGISLPLYPRFPIPPLEATHHQPPYYDCQRRLLPRSQSGDVLLAL